MKYVTNAKYHILIFTSFLTLFILYLPSLLSGPFWDDNLFIFSSVAPIVKANSPLIFWSKTSSLSKAWPLGYSIYWIIFKFFAHNYVVYKYLAIFFHFINAVLIERLFKKEKIAFPVIGALIFLFHPLNVETVSWIIQLNSIFALLFFLGSLHFFLGFAAKKQWPIYAVSVVLFFLSMATKSIAVCFPILFLIILIKRQQNTILKKIILIIPFVLISINFSSETIRGINSSNMEKRFSTIHNESTLLSTSKQETIIVKPIWSSLANIMDKISMKLIITSQNFIFYAGKFILPINQIFMYPKWKLASFFNTIPMIFLLMTIAIAALGKFHRYKIPSKQRKSLIFFILCFIPISGIVYIPYMKYSYVADHWSYFPIIGLTALFLSSIGHFSETVKKQKIAHAFLVIFVLFLAFQTYNYSKIFNNQETLLEKNLTINPGELFLYKFLAQIYRKSGNIKMMRITLERARTIAPDDGEIITSLMYIRKKKR